VDDSIGSGYGLHMACKAVRTIRAALKPPSSGRKLAKLTGVPQPTLNQIANEKHGARKKTRDKLRRTLGIQESDWE